MPELRSATHDIWNASGIAYQARYEQEIKRLGDPATFDEYLAARDPLTEGRIRVNMIIKAFDNEVVGRVVNQMAWAVIDLSASPNRLLTSDRPADNEFFRLKEPNGAVSLPISPIKLFVAANDRAFLDRLRDTKPRDIVHSINKYVTTRARRFVWSCDQSQDRFIRNNMSTKLEPTPLLPNISHYGLPSTPDAFGK
jgi:Protein of unknown function (DUF4238)